MTVPTERFERTVTIAAPITTVFAFLADPAMHPRTEPSDWVREAIDPEPITATGQLFGMRMGFPGTGQPYVMHNRVTAYEPDRVLEWEPGQLNDEQELDTGGWRWRYDLAPTQDGTRVQLSYDWSATSQAIRDEIGGLPPFEPEFLDRSLASLRRAILADES